MVYLRKKQERGKEYYYLEHSRREGGKIKKYSRYIGADLPSERTLENIRSSFFQEIFEKIWFSEFDEILENYALDIQNTPHSAIEKSNQAFAIRFTYNSNRIEGNTLNLRETKILLEDGIAPGKVMDDIKETEAHQRVFKMILKQEEIITKETLLAWHFELFKNTKYDIAGAFRKHQVAISGSEFTPPHYIEVQEKVDEFFSWFLKANQEMILHPVELAALAHLKLVSIHPFSDGNGRISRLMMNWVLNRYNYPMLVIEYKGRKSYYSSLERSQLKQEPYIFVQYIFRNYLKTYKKKSK